MSRQKDKEFAKRMQGHAKFIRGLPCLKCGLSQCSEYSLGDGDVTMVPLCRHCAPKLKEHSFWVDVDRVKQIARSLHLITGDIWTATNIILTVRLKEQV